MICYVLTDIFELGGSTTTSKTSGLIPPTKIGFHDNDVCFRTTLPLQVVSLRRPCAGLKRRVVSCTNVTCMVEVFIDFINFVQAYKNEVFVSLQTNMFFKPPTLKKGW